MHLFFSLDPASAAGQGVGAADVLLQAAPGPGFGIYAPAAALGLGPGDDIDALSILDLAPASGWRTGNRIYFSLAPGSPALTVLGAGAADILFVDFGAPPAVWARAAALGLPPGDDIDGLDIYDPADPLSGPTAAAVPTVSTAGAVMLAALLLTAAVVLMKFRSAA